jgi:3-oxoacyl-[acyl-carrier protein] reductase
MSELEGKVALVTGGSQGIGEAVAELLASNGVTVAVVASGSLGKAEAVAGRLNGKSGKAKGFAADVRDAAQVNRLVEEVTKAFGRIDILINSAGVFYPTPAGSTAQAEFDRMVDINFKGTWNAINAVVPGMKKQKHGKIVNFASVCAVMGFGSFATYCATKAAVQMLTRTLAIELAPHGININSIGPGNTATPINEYVRTDPAYKGVLADIVARTPSGKAYSDAEDMAKIVRFLVSDASRAMHGSFVLADEGYSAGADFSSAD